MQRPVRIAPSILSADFARLGEEVRAAAEAGADLIHVDVMDGHFVPNITIGPEVVKALKRHTALPLDVHLMIEPVDPYISAFAEAGADIITVHVEASADVGRTVELIRKNGPKAGLSLKPATPAGEVLPWLEKVDLVLVMTVEPGFGGQPFMSSEIEKIREFRSAIDASGLAVDLEVDGGITPQTAPAAIGAGADILVAGSWIFQGGARAYGANIARLRGQGASTRAAPQLHPAPPLRSEGGHRPKISASGAKRTRRTPRK